MSKAWTIALVPALLLTGAAAAQNEPRAGDPAEISLARRNAIRDFRADADGRAAHLQDRQRNWYRASFEAPCRGLLIGFRTDAGQVLKPGAAVLMRNVTMGSVEHCRVAALVRSGPPPRQRSDASSSIETPWRDRPAAIGAVSESSRPDLVNPPRP